jgi:RNA polymerase sigma-70 factor (ECF subfamily)
MSTAILSYSLRPAVVTRQRYDSLVPSGQRELRVDSLDHSLDHAFARGQADLRDAYEAHGRLVYSICRRTLDAEAAKDVTQDVFVSAWRGRDQFDPAKGSLGAWLVGITKRRVIDHVRSERRHADRRADEASDTPATVNDTSVDQLANRVIVVDALQSLPNRTREIIELAYIHDLTHHAIAERTGVPLGTVKSDIRRGLLRIRELMEPTHG